MRGYDYIIVCAPLWLSHSGAKGAGRKGCWKRVVPSHSVLDYSMQSLESSIDLHNTSNGPNNTKD